MGTGKREQKRDEVVRLREKLKATCLARIQEAADGKRVNPEVLKMAGQVLRIINRDERNERQRQRLQRKYAKLLSGQSSKGKRSGER
jgi:hypothetical protein